MAQKIIWLTFLVFLILQHNFGTMEASRKLIHIHPPPAIPRSPQAPALWYTPNDEDGGHDAFRPTCRGHSPGAGHDNPPTKP